MKFTTLISEVTVSSDENPNIIKISLRNDKTMVYAVQSRGGLTIDKNLEFDYEPLPSSRTDAFIKRTRFKYEKALEIAKKYLEKTK